MITMTRSAVTLHNSIVTELKSTGTENKTGDVLCRRRDTHYWLSVQLHNGPNAMQRLSSLPGQYVF